jgi:hypothetical protein
MAQYEYDKQIKQITSFILKLKEDINAVNNFVLQKIDNEIIKLRLDKQDIKDEFEKKMSLLREEVISKDEIVSIDNQRIQQTITDSFKPIETKVEMVSKNMESVFSYIKDIEDKTQNTVVGNTKLLHEKDIENKQLLQSHKEEIQQYVSNTIQKINELATFVMENDVAIKEETSLLLSSVSDKLDDFIISSSSFVEEEILKIKS